MNLPEQNSLVYLGETSFRNEKVRFGIKQDDRRRHMYVVGSTGMGKSEFLKNMAIQDIEAGRGVCFIDPHGDSVDALLDFVPEERVKDVVYFNPNDLEYPIAFNVMEKVDFEYRHLVSSGLLGVFKKIWGAEAWSGRMEYILNNTILALLEYPGSTLLAINRMMAAKDYRKKVVANIKDPIVKGFWVEEFAKYADKFATEATAAIQNKIGGFISNNLIRNVIGQPASAIDMRKIMDEGKILLVDISRGRIGEDASRLLGALLVTKIQLAAMSRVDIPEKDRKDFYLYVDEFQHFATESFANILSEARKYHLNLIMAHQYIKQMEEPVMDAVFGNVGTIVTFRVGAEDAEYLEKWFQPDFMMSDIVNLGKYTVYMKLMIEGISSKGFSANMIPPFTKPDQSNREAIIAYSRATYGTPKEKVEKDIADWAGPMVEEVIREERRDDFRNQRGVFTGPMLQGRRADRPFGAGGNDRGGFRREEGQRRADNPPQGRPRSADYRPNNIQQSVQRAPLHTPPLPKPPREVSLNALSSEPVDFKGHKIQPKPPRQQEKKGVDTAELKKLLEDSLKKSE